eukprot:CAMPEP_0116836314 /NCGR_PEP_ID=MMETSP0418-20121206/8027_1 /TAXON_ID=1158023 /ORGANISM="Astrosyne radiata, Strain 13vi08-1A" /LENGTH=253 /DNA_ID=CAMNT_0004466069 /DNA_START=267 /DNA_END=1028 /DNA_ORIENTATION=-
MARQQLQDRYDEFVAKQDTKAPDWPEKAARYEKSLLISQEKAAAKAHEDAMRAYQKKEGMEEEPETPTEKKDCEYQMVGVIRHSKKNNNDNNDNHENVQWYARKKPADSNWNVRLVHVNRAAIIRDLFCRGKVDVVAEYKNMGNTREPDQDDEVIVKAQYKAKPRSWRNLWNFSPKHFFTDSSGMFWRERRLSPGIYTDGVRVYETTYRYHDGRNGIRDIGSLSGYLDKYPEEKDDLLKRLETGKPDLIQEGK